VNPDRDPSEGRTRAEDAPDHRRRFADALRGVASEVVSRDAPEELFREAVVAAEALAARMSVAAGPTHERTRDDEGSPGIESSSGPSAALQDCSPVTGKHNPIAPPLRIHKENESGVTASIVFSDALEGAPGVAHGGIVAAAFDELLGLTQPPGRKADRSSTLKVRYRTPCPLHAELSMKSMVKKMDGQKTSVRGTLHAGDRLVADAEAIFIMNDSPSQ
jgi:acyl-coenzyme A thioesterase PaaI-like protein